MSLGFRKLAGALAIAASVVVAVVVPGRASVEAPSSPTPGHELDGRELVAARVVGRELVGGTELRLSFEDGYLGANAGCNDEGGSYVVKKGRLRLLDGSVTDMGCDTTIMRQEDWFFGLLSGASVTQRGSRVVLRRGRVSISFIAALDPTLPDAIIERDWRLTHFKMQGEPLRELGYRPARDKAPRISLSDRIAHLHSSCASASSDIRIRQATATIKFLTTDSSWNRHEDAGRCAGARGKIDRTMRGVLSGRVRIQRTADHLTLRRAGNVLRFAHTASATVPEDE